MLYYAYQCRKAHIQRNHIHCALLVWTRLKHLSYQWRRSTYEIKRKLLSDYLFQQLKNPSVSISMAFLKMRLSDVMRALL